LHIELNTPYWKYKESGKISVVASQISQPSLDMSPIWTAVVEEEIGKW
jgi:hypothetical protein